MTRTPALLSILMAGLMAAAGAQAQSSPVSEAPVSTKDQLRQDAQGMNRATTTEAVPPRAGEASAITQGKPNMDPKEVVGARTRAEVRAELLASRANFENGRRVMMGTPQ
ncbi:MAG TPA: hypothetical protein VK981_03850 [Ramlibacter sp.]|nr:hypothetical protein [Ramlibacter sp.]